METLRCLIADIPQKILADIVQTVTQQRENIEVIEQLTNLSSLVETLRDKAVDVLILGIQKSTPRDLCLELAEQFPDLLIIALVDDGRMAVVYLSNVGSNQLVEAIVMLCGGIDRKSVEDSGTIQGRAS
ncbi:MAG: response regulator transcription factor [bacterium]|nr:response regulator transcription factor [bacterium]